MIIALWAINWLSKCYVKPSVIDAKSIPKTQPTAPRNSK